MIFFKAIEVTFKTPQKVMVTGELKKVEEVVSRFLIVCHHNKSHNKLF